MGHSNGPLDSRAEGPDAAVHLHIDVEQFKSCDAIMRAPLIS